MRRIIFLVILFFVLFLSDAHAASIGQKGSWERKLQRGFLNVVFSPLEISHALAQEKKDAEWPNWITGLGIGTWFAVIRAGSGIYDMLTFPFPFPRNYEPTMQPEFALEYLGFFAEEKAA